MYNNWNDDSVIDWKIKIWFFFFDIFYQYNSKQSMESDVDINFPFYYPIYLISL
jgi:hypothetical protein